MDYSVAVHEVGNIVTLMKYSISKLKEEYPEIMGSDYFEYIEADTQKLKELVISAKPQKQCRGKKEININEMLVTMCYKHSELCYKSGIELNCYVDNSAKEKFLITGDELLIEQVMGNIIKNAEEELIEQKINNGKIVVSVKGIKRKGIDYVDVLINNNGTIIDKEKIDMIFKRNYTEKNHGTGIGLYFCRKTIEEHNGKIKVVSNNRLGTTFIISLKLNKLS